MPKYDFYLKEIEVDKIRTNPENPRGKFIRDNDDQFQYLKRSIRELGLLVPIVVQEIKNNNGYVLLDGERRYYALKELGIKQASAHVLKNEITPEKAKALMFHVHTNRKQWDAFQQCRALEPMYDELKKKFEGNENHIAKEIALLTGANKRTVNSRLSFLRWPVDVKKMIYNSRNDLWYSVVEIEDQIISPAQKNFPKYFEKVDVNDVRRFLFQKFVDGVVHAATEARKVSSIVKTPTDDKKKYMYAKTVFEQLVTETKYTFENAREDFLSEYPGAEEDINETYKKISSQIKKTINMMGNFNSSILDYKTPKDRSEFSSLLESLETAIQTLYNEIHE